ncbi:hypothetical protein D3C81_1868900 [compost metagenome]
MWELDGEESESEVKENVIPFSREENQSKSSIEDGVEHTEDDEIYELLKKEINRRNRDETN